MAVKKTKTQEKKKKTVKKTIKQVQKKTSPKTETKTKRVSKKAPKAISQNKEVKKKTNLPSPQSMEELLMQTNYNLKTFKKGDLVQATLTDKGKRTAFFDIGAKTEGLAAGKELEQIKDFLNGLNIGDVVEARIITPENEKGQIILSLREAADNWKWELLEQYYKGKKAVEVRGLDVNKGGMIARIMGIRGFIPTSQFGQIWAGKLEELYNKLFPVKIIEVDREKNRLIFSEKAVSEEEVLKQQALALTQVKVGKDYEGEVSGVMPFGLFVRIPVSAPAKKKGSEKPEDVFLDGLVHISQVSWEKIDDLKKLYKTGQKVKVRVVDVDEKSGKLNLSIKQLQTDPWEEIAKKYKPDTKLKGTVTRLVAFGAFVQLDSGIEGLIHISKIPAEQEMKVGKKVDVYIESLDLEQHRISLGLVLKEKPVGYK